LLYNISCKVFSSFDKLGSKLLLANIACVVQRKLTRQSIGW
jgi:hypothetical protein